MPTIHLLPPSSKCLSQGSEVAVVRKLGLRNSMEIQSKETQSTTQPLNKSHQEKNKKKAPCFACETPYLDFFKPGFSTWTGYEFSEIYQPSRPMSAKPTCLAHKSSHGGSDASGTSYLRAAQAGWGGAESDTLGL